MHNSNEDELGSKIGRGSAGVTSLARDSGNSRSLRLDRGAESLVKSVSLH